MDSHYPGLRQKAMRTSARLEAKRSGHLRPTPNAHWSNSFHIFVLTDDDASFLGDGIYVFVMTGRDFRWCDRLAHWSGSKQPRGLYWSHEWITECRFVRWFWLLTFWTSTSVFINHKWMQFCCRMIILSSNLIFNIICWISTNLFFFFLLNQKTLRCLQNQLNNICMINRGWKPKMTKWKAVKCNSRSGQLISSSVMSCFQRLNIIVAHIHDDIAPQTSASFHESQCNMEPCQIKGFFSFDKAKIDSVTKI